MRKYFLAFIACFFSFIPGWGLQKIVPTEQKPITVIIFADNNEKYIEKNLTSIFSQNYENFRVIYIDDHSSDTNFQKAKYLVKYFGKEKQTILIQNTEKKGYLANIYNAVHFCEDHEIIVLVDGNSFLTHEEVFNILNQAYVDPNIWLTYGNYLEYPFFKPIATSKPISEKIIKNNSYRKEAWPSMHLFTFYASLFKEISLEDLIDRGHFFLAWENEAIAVSLLELGGRHARFIENYLYLHNTIKKEEKIDPILQDECIISIRNKLPHLPLQKLTSHQKMENANADLVAFSKDLPMQLYALLESSQRFVKGINKINVLYRATTEEYDRAYDDLKRSFPKVHFIKQINPPHDFKQRCLDLINEAVFPSSLYVLFATDRMIFKDFVDLSSCIHALETTKTYGFYLSHSEILDVCAQQKCHQDIPSYISLNGISNEDALLAWQFSEGTYDWATPDQFQGVLYRKANVKKDLLQLSFNDPKSLKESWGALIPLPSVGLFFAQSKCIQIGTQSEIKWQISARDLLEKFNAGFKIDIVRFLQMQNRSLEIDKPISFVTRN